MKKILSIFLFLGYLSGFAQIKGTVSDQAGQTLAYVNVLLLNPQDSSLLKGGISDVNGNFNLRPPTNGNYIVKVSFIGYNTYFSSPVDYQSQAITLGVIRLFESTKLLGEAEVRAAKPLIQVGVGKTIFNVSANLSAGSGNAQDLLRAAPGLFVDQNDQLILEGRSGVQVYVDGRPLNLQGDDQKAYLQNLQSDQIDKIEIISQPGAQYDAAGNAGIINIVLKRDQNLGTQGSLSHRYTQGYYPRNNGNVNLYHNRRALRLLGSIGYGLNESRNFMNLYRQQNGIDFDRNSVNQNNNKGYNARLGADWRISAKQKLGISVKGNLNDNYSLGNSRTPIIPDSTGVINQVLVALGEDKDDNYSVFSNVYYRIDDDNWNWGIDLDHGRFSAISATDQPNRYLDGEENVLLSENHYQMETDRSFNLYSLKTDLSRNIKDWKFNTGIKWSQVSTANDFDFFILNGNIRDQDPSRSNLFDYTENISAVYTETSKEWASWSLQAGLRYEYTNSSGQLSTLDASGDSLVERSYGNLFPNLALSYKKNPMNQWSFNYSRRIERPNYQNLNPFLYQRDELSFSQGNPFLIPQISDNFRIAHLYKYSTSTALSYSYTSDFFAQITDTVGLDRNSMTTRNVADSRSVSLSVGSPIPGNDWWDSYLSLTSFQTWYLPVDPSFEAIDQFTLSLYAQSNFKLPKNYQFQVSGWFSSPGVWGGTYRTESLGSLNASISKTMMNDRLKVFVNFNDILFTSPWQGNMSYGALQIRGNGGNDSRQIEFGLSYRFGNEKVNQLKLEKGGLEDESKRVN